MAVERITPQLVKKGKGKKRPGYRGPGGYQGGRSSSTSSGKSGNTGTGNRPNPHTKSGYSKTTTVSGDRMRSSARETQQAINNARAIEDAKKAKRDAKNKNITKFGYNKPKSKIGGILGTIAGMLMGIPGLGLLTGGLGSLGNKLGDTFGNFNETMRGINPVTGKANTQAEYEAMVADRRTQSRIDKMQDRINRGYNQIGFGDFTKQTGPITDNQRATLAGLLGQKDRFGNQFGPSTAQNVLTGRDLKGFTPSRMGLQTMTPMSKPTFSDPFANTVGTTTKVNAPASDAVSSYSYGTADAAIPGVETTPSYINEFLNKPITPGKSLPGTSFIDRLYNPEQIVELENKYGNEYGILNSAAGPLSDARHMAAMNNLSTSLSPMDNKFGNFIGDTLAFGAGLINEVPALGRGFNKQNLGEIVEDIKANYAGSFGTPNQTTSEDIYNQVFGNQQMAQLGPSFADGGIASMFTRRG